MTIPHPLRILGRIAGAVWNPFGFVLSWAVLTAVKNDRFWAWFIAKYELSGVDTTPVKEARARLVADKYE